MEQLSMKEKRREYGRARGEKARERRMALVVELSRRSLVVGRMLAEIEGREPPRPLLEECGRCDNCGRDLHASDLEVDHVDGRSWEMHRVGRWTRVERMWRELRDGVRLRALCRYCNARGGSRRYYGGRR